MRKLCLGCILIGLAAPLGVASAQQSSGGSGCSIAEPPFHSNKPNIFSDQQEQWLGDAQTGQVEAEYTLFPEKDSADLERIGNKLLAQLPPTPIHFRFRIYDADELNAFSLAGGYVYVGRKLIRDAQNEDELAGVMAHEIGHIYTHAVAIAFSRQLKAMLGVTSVSEKSDIEDKVQLLLNAPWKDKAAESEDDAEKDELLADRVGLYALIRAGYDPKVFSENLDRITANKGRTSGFLSGLLGKSNEIGIRISAARKIVSSLPSGCKELKPASSSSFLKFQESIRVAPTRWRVPPTPGLRSFALNPRMRPALEQVRFSQDGNYVLAQDASSIHILNRTPLKLLFSIDAPGALSAQFSPDSTHVALHYAAMRTELWDIASQKRESFHDLVDYDGCQNTSLSPDGKTFVCLRNTDRGAALKLIDVESGKPFYDNKSFYEFSGTTPPEMIRRLELEPGLAKVVYSQDGHTLLVVAGARAMAFDLMQRKPIALHGNLSQLYQSRIDFVNSKELLFECGLGEKQKDGGVAYKLCLSSFPEGSLINSFKLGWQWMDSVARGNQVVIGPVGDNAAVLLDPSTGKSTAAFKLSPIDALDKIVASESGTGGVAVADMESSHLESAELPIGPIQSLSAAEFSPDGKLLGFSDASRSSLWDLSSKRLVSTMRPFVGLRFEPQDKVLVHFKTSYQKPGQNSQIDLHTGKVTDGAKYEKTQMLYGEALIQMQPMDKTSKSLAWNTELQVSDPMTGTQLWTRRFPHESPFIWQTQGDTLLIGADLRTWMASDASSHSGIKTIKSSDTRRDWFTEGLIVEVVSGRTGEVQQVISTPLRASGSAWSEDRFANLYGDYLLVHGNYNNTVIYRRTDGTRLGGFFGRAIAGDGDLKLIAATNRDQDLAFYDATNGKELQHLTLDEVPLAARFIPSQRVLLVLTANQTVYSIDLPAH